MPNPDWFPKPPAPKPLPVGVIVLFLVIGVACLTWGGHDLLLAAASTKWATTPGTVMASDAGESTSESYDRERSGNKTRTHTSYSPSASYTYRVGGALLHGDCIFIGQGFHMDRKAASSLIARYPPLQRITVHYDPHRPERSVLEPGIRARNWSAAVVGAVFTLLGWSAAVGRRTWRKSQKNDGDDIQSSDVKII